MVVKQVETFGGLPQLVLGGATLNTQYNDNPYSIPVVDMLKYAFANGIKAIDTSPYYGPSEIIYGEALESIQEEWPRNSYQICTKVGRIQLDDFDYSKEHVRSSVLRSCERLKTNYLDVLYLHDIEFVEEDMILEALTEMRKLKDEGIVLRIGISGYPVDFLYQIAKKCKDIECIGSLDNILSYCNLNLQNLILEQYYDKFIDECQVKTVSNGSILSMSLLTSGETKSFHPCSQELRDRSSEAAKYLLKEGVEIADLATKYAIFKWLNRGPTVLGCSNVVEVEHALRNYKGVIDNGGLTTKENQLVTHVQESIFKELMNSTWESGIRGR
ncbi:Ara2 [Kluyveromyces lactis]|nr:Ara2 [Kluyveromyces lactis]